MVGPRHQSRANGQVSLNARVAGTNCFLHHAHIAQLAVALSRSQRSKLEGSSATSRAAR